MTPALPGVPRGARLAVVCLALLSACHGGLVTPPGPPPLEQERIDEIVRVLETVSEDASSLDQATARLRQARSLWDTAVAPYESLDGQDIDTDDLINGVWAAGTLLKPRPQALEAYQWMGEIARLVDDDLFEAQALTETCNVLVDLRRFEQARTACVHALELGEDFNQTWRLVLQTLLTITARDLGNNNDLEVRSQELARQIGEGSQIGDDYLAEAHFVLGSASWELAHYDAALESYSNAVTLFEETSQPTRQADTLVAMGLVHDRLGERQDAHDLYQHARALYTAENDHKGLADVWQATGLAWRNDDQMDDALEAFELSLEEIEQMPVDDPDRRQEAASSSWLLGVTLSEVGQIDEAHRRFSEALDLFRRADDAGGIADSLEGLASVQLARGELDTAFAHLDEAETINRNNHRQEQLADTLHVRARAHIARGELEQALESARETVDVVLDVRSSAGDPVSRAGLSASLRRHYELHVKTLMLLHQAEPGGDWAIQALRASEAARAQSLREEIELARRNQASAALQRERRELLARLSELDVLESSLAASARRFDSLGTPHFEETTQFEITLERGAVESALARVDEKIARQFPRLTIPEAISVGEIRRLLDADTVFLEFFLGKEHSYLWIVTLDDFHSLELKWPRSEIETLIREMASSTQVLGQTHWDSWGQSKQEKRKAVERFDRAAARLSEILLRPVADRGALDRPRLVIVGDGALRYLPFAALPHPDHGGFLVASHETIRLDSASVLQMQRRPGLPGTATRQASREIALIANPDYGDQDIPLPGTYEEARAISTLFPDDQMLRLLEADATRRNVLDSDLGQHRIVHFATHGRVDAREPERSYLQLAQDPDGDDRLSLVDIYSLRLDATELVVLSACETAMGREIRGEGVISLARGFTYAGADTVVATLWRVNDHYTAELMAEFYRGMLEEERAPSAALAAAQRSYIEENPTARPHEWAGFMLQGDWQ